MDLTRFDRYVEANLARGRGARPLHREAGPPARRRRPALTLLRESFEDLHLAARRPRPALAAARTRPSTAVGKIVYREVRRSDLVAMLIDKKFKPVHDRIRNRRDQPRSSAAIPDRTERRQAAKVFLELFRLLHYLEYTDPERLPEESLRDTILPFALVTSETRLLLAYVEKRVLKGRDLQRPLYQVYDSFVYCVPLELQEGGEHRAQRHLGHAPGRERAHAGREQPRDPQGLLPAVGGAARPGVRPRGRRGAHLPGLHRASASSRCACATGWSRSIRAVREFQERKDEAAAARMKDGISDFYDHHIKYLMYRDWSGFELFYIEILKCGSMHRAAADRPPLRDLPGHPPARGPEALDPAGRRRGREDTRSLVGRA